MSLLLSKPKKILNLRQKRTLNYNKIIDELWQNKLDVYKQNPILKNVDFSNIDNINFENYYKNHINYANQIYDIYYFNKINGFILSDDDDDNPLINQMEIYKLLKDIQNEKRGFYDKSMRKYMAVYKIQQWWKPIFYNPRNNLMDTMIDNHFSEYESSLKKSKYK